MSNSIVDKVRDQNPYPLTVFPDLKGWEYEKIREAIQSAGFTSDRVHGAWGHVVWKNCCDAFAQHLSSSPSAGVWRKASEKLPEKDKHGFNFHVKATTDWQGYDHNDTAIYRGDGTWEFLPGNESRRVTEWLDPTPSEQESDWVSVEDQSPEKFGYYLVWEVNYGKPHEDIYHYNPINDSWTSSIRSGDAFHPTHWMKLPQPPKSK